VFAGLVLGFFYFARGPAPELEVRAGVRDAGSGAIHAGDHQATSESESGSRHEVGAPRARGAAVKRTVRVIGQCVRHDNGEPVAGVELSVRLDLAETGLYRLALPDVRRWRPPEPVVSDDEGRFAIRMPMPRQELPLVLDIAAPYAAVTEGFDVDPDDLEGTQKELVVDVDQVEIHPGFFVRGTVVDQHGEPVDGDILSMGSFCALVDHGRFDFGAVREGEYDFFLEHHGEVVEPREIVVGPGFDTTRVRVVVNVNAGCEGIVVDGESGKPIPNFELSARFPGSAGSTTTDANGRFRIFANSLDEQRVRFEPLDFEVDSAKPRLVGPTPWFDLPARGIVLRTRRWPEFLVRVRDPGGAPATRHRIYPHGGYLLERVRTEGGVVTWRGLHPGKNLVRIETDTATSDWLELDPLAWYDVPFQVDLAATERLTVRVAMPNSLKSTTSAVLRSERGWMAKGRADAAGVIELAAPHEIAGMRLIVTSRPAQVELRLTAEHERTRRVEVELTDSRPVDPARLSVRVAGAAAGVSDKVLQRYLGVRRNASEKPVRLSPPGVVSLPAGVWEVITLPSVRCWTPQRGWFDAPSRERVLARVELQANDNKTVTVDVPEIVPGSVSGTAKRNGVPLRYLTLQFFSVDGRWSSNVRVDGQGRFGREYLPLGRYYAAVVAVPVLDVTPDRTLWFPGVVEVFPGQNHEVVLALRDEAVKLRVLFPDGRPAADTWLDVRYYGKVHTDARAFVRLDSPPPGKVTLETVRGGRKASLVLPRQPAAGPLVVRLQ